MSYSYKEMRPSVFSEDGQVTFLKIRDNAKQLLDTAGAATVDKMMRNVTDDSWTIMACVDRLVELGELIEVPNPASGWGQHRIFTKSLS